MRNYVYFWIENYHCMKSSSKHPLYLFDDFSVNLSSKYKITHKWFKKKRIFSFETCEKNKYSESNLKNDFYSDNIVDLKIFLGNNGSGKSSLIELLADIISGRNLHNDCTYILVWEENEKMQYFLHKGEFFEKEDGSWLMESSDFTIKSKFHIKETFLKKNAVILYSLAFPNYWSNLDTQKRYNHCCDIRTSTLLKENVEILNNGLRRGATKNNLICYSKIEENKIVDFVSDFYKTKINGRPFLKETLALPSEVFFRVSDENINNGIQEIAEKTESKKNNVGNLVKQWKDFYNQLVKFDDQIKFACIINAFRTKNYSLDSSRKIDYSAFTIEKIRNLDDFLKNIHLYLRDQSFSKVYEKTNSLIKILKPFKYDNWFPLYTYCYKIEIEKKKKELKEVRALLNELESVTRIMDMEWGRPLSSGESSYLMFFGRLYSCLKDYKENIESLYKENGKTFQGCLFCDELDLYLHPEWQRMWFSKFLDGLSLLEVKLRLPMKIQLFIATHSPFMVTDFSSESVLTLQRKEVINGVWGSTVVKADVLKNTMAGNIYDILDSGFIVGGTLGYFIEKKIKELLKRIEERKCTTNDKEFIKQIGDPIIQSIISNRMRS